jgi:hypothetical protein
VAIVNQAWVRTFMNGEDPLGNASGPREARSLTRSLAVVTDYRPMGTENGTRPQIFWPYLKLNNASLLVRTRACSR